LSHHMLIESHGVRVEVEFDDAALRDEIERILPPGWSESEEFPEDGHLTLRTADAGSYDVVVNGAPVVAGVRRDVAIQVLDAQLRSVIAFAAPDRIFVHAGAVAIDERALLLPGPSFAGKSSLTAALVKAGAVYLSDEFAVLDERGLVSPYAKPLSIRGVDEQPGELTTVEALGGTSGQQALEVALIAVLTYEAAKGWDVRPMSPGEGALALLSNTVPARSRPAQTLEAVGSAARSAEVIAGTRGDADEAAGLLIDMVTQSSGRPASTEH
jgi:hypothetical protein